MTKIELQVGPDVCDILMGKPLGELSDELLRRAGKGTKVLIVVDEALARSYGMELSKKLLQKGLQAEILLIPSGESSKIYNVLATRSFERKSWLIALGGGVIGDLAGFAAATYLRGLSFVQVPTTLLAQVDASIGGKTAVDIPQGKNLVGAFYQPKIVWIDPHLLKTLPKRQWQTGAAEVIKYGAIWDLALFKLLEKQIDYLMKGYSPAWNPIIARCAQIKAHIVQKDPRETKGLRALLNFGHSVGHAIEAATQYESYTHGEAISIGMFVAGLLSQQAGFLDAEERLRLGMLLRRAGLPSTVKKAIPRTRLMEFLARDKKVEKGAVKFVLLKGLGRAVSGQLVAPEDLDAALAASKL
jgi:3-dehydroquinate synthase